MKRLVLPAIVLLAAGPLGAQQPEVLARIKTEGLMQSHVDSLAGHLFDVIGQRLTGSPSLRQAEEWAQQTLSQWGLANARREPWDSLFGRGWERVSYEGHFTAPYNQPLYATPMAWSGSTRGSTSCDVKLFELSDSTDFNALSGSFRGACILVVRRYGRSFGTFRDVLAPEWNPSPRRTDADSILAIASRPARTIYRLGQHSPTEALEQRFGGWLAGQDIVAVLDPSPWQYDILIGSAGPQALAARLGGMADPLPALVVAHEQAGQIYRDLRRGVPVRLELDEQNRFGNPDGREFNVLADLPGTDLADQWVMIGAHLDSWYPGTGATDDGAGVVIMMEAMRILKTLNLPMRRSVRIALWSGEEQGMLGSFAWVRQHAADLPHLAAYLNADEGTGRVRGVYAQGNAPAEAAWNEILAPLHDLGVVVAIPGGTPGGTDHLPFDAAGVPAFQLLQDPIEYFSRTHHSQADTYDHLVMDDLKQAATVVAWSVYVLANRDEPMPRKAAQQ